MISNTSTMTGLSTSSKPEGKGLWKPLLLLTVVVAALAAAKVFNLGEQLAGLQEWIHSFGPWGVVVFIVLYIAMTVAMLPGSVLTLAAGAMFGSLVGVIAVSIASTIGVSLAFLISRYFAREAVEGWFSGNEKLQKLDRMTERQGAAIVAITRLVPLFPFNLLNYGFGLTRVKFGTYVLWSWLCMLPGTILYVMSGDAVAQGLAGGGVPWGLVAGVGGIALVLFVVVRRARGRLGDDE